MKPRKNFKGNANLVNSHSDGTGSFDTPFEEQSFGSLLNNPSSSTTSKVDASLVQALAQEMRRMVKDKQGMDMQSSDSNAFAHFAGMTPPNSHSHISCAVLNNALGCWINDH